MTSRYVNACIARLFPFLDNKSHDRGVLVRLSFNAGSLGIYTRGGVPLFLADSALSPTAFGILSNNREWKLVLDAYNEDELESAYRAGLADGSGSGGEFAEAFAIIAAEYETGRQSEITRMSEWLEIEAIPSQLRLDLNEIAKTATTAISSIFRAIGLQIGLPILLTVLDSDVALPVHLEKTGYVTIKKNYAKYCIPSEALADLTGFQKRVEALAACQAAGVLSAESAAAWLITSCEALSSIAVEPQIRARFCAGDLPWLKPHELNLALIGVKPSEDEEAGAAAALAQAILIGRYLLAVEKPTVLRKCLSYHMPLSMHQHIRLIMSNDPTRDACKQTFGYAPEYLFEQALASTCK